MCLNVHFASPDHRVCSDTFQSQVDHMDHVNPSRPFVMRMPIFNDALA